VVRDTAVLVWLRLARVFQKIDRASEVHLRAWDLSVAQFDILAHLWATEGMMQQELAHSLLVTKGNISQLVERLEARGLLRRCQHGRALLLYLTERGRKLAEEVVPAHERFIAAQLAVLDAPAQEQLRALLHRLDRALDGQVRSSWTPGASSPSQE
jgi:DNA-binding MarR family transcriptional regulator